MDTWIVYIIAPAVTSLLTYVLTRTSRRIDATSKLVAMLQEEIGRLGEKIQKLENKIEQKERNEGRLMIVIQEAYQCRTPSQKCPVLKMQAYFNRQKITYENSNNVGDTVSDERLLSDPGCTDEGAVCTA